MYTATGIVLVVNSEPGWTPTQALARELTKEARLPVLSFVFRDALTPRDLAEHVDALHPCIVIGEATLPDS